MAAGRPFRVEFLTDTKKFNKGVKKAEGRLKKFGAGMAKIGKAGAAGFAVATAAVAAFAVQGLKDFVELEHKVREVGTLMGKVGSEVIADLTDQIERVAVASGQSAVDVAGAFYDSISAGVDPAVVEDFVGTAGKLAVAGATDINSSVDLLTSAINAFGLESSDALAVSDTFFNTVKFGKTTITEIASAFSKVGPVAAATGLSLEEVGGAIAAITLQGTPTEIAANQVRSAVAELGTTGKKSAMLFEEATGKSFRNFIAEGGTLVEAMDIIGATAAEKGLAIPETFNRIEGAAAALALSGPNLARFRDIVASMGNAAGATDTAFEVMAESASIQFSIVREQFNVAKRAFGEAFLPVAMDLLPHISAALEKLGPILAEGATRLVEFGRTTGPEMLARFSTFRGELEKISEVVSEKFYAAVQTYGVPAVNALGVAIQAASGPWGRFLAVLFRLSDEYGPQIMGWFDSVKPVIVGVAERVRDSLGPAWEVVLETLEKVAAVVWDGLKLAWEWVQEQAPKVVEAVSQVWAAIVERWESGEGRGMGKAWQDIVDLWHDHLWPTLQSAWDFIVAFAESMAQIFGVKFVEFFATLLDNWEQLWTTMIEALSYALDIIKGVLDIFTGLLSGDWSKIWEGLKTIFVGFWTSLGNILRAWVPGFMEKVDDFLQTFKDAIAWVWNAIVWLFETGWQAIEKLFDEGWAGLFDLARQQGNGMIAIFESVANSAIRAFRSVFGAWNDFSVRFPGVEVMGRQIVPAFTIDTPNIPLPSTISIPRLARGGVVTSPTLALIGEAGPEAVIPLGRGAGGVTVNFYGPVYGDEYQLGDLVVNALSDWTRRNGPVDLAVGRA